MRVHHHDVSALRPEAVDGDCQLALADVLKRVVDRKHYGRSGLRLLRPPVGRIQGASVVVTRQAHLARIAAKETVERQLETIERIAATVERPNDAPDSA